MKKIVSSFHKRISHQFRWLFLMMLLGSTALLAQQSNRATGEDIIEEPSVMEYIQRVQSQPLSDLAIQRAEAKQNGDAAALKKINALLFAQSAERSGEDAAGEVLQRISNTVVNYDAPSIAPPLPNNWNTDVAVNDAIGVQSQPSMATASDGTIYITFRTNTITSINDIVIYKSVTRGLSWD